MSGRVHKAGEPISVGSIRLTYQAEPGEAQAAVTVAQDVGTCSGAVWRPATTEEAFPVSAVVLEDERDLGFVRFELAIGLPADVLDDATFGFGLSVESAPDVIYRLPGHDGFPLLGDDVTSWENVFFTTPSTRPQTPPHVFVDGVPRKP